MGLLRRLQFFSVGSMAIALASCTSIDSSKILNYDIINTIENTEKNNQWKIWLSSFSVAKGAARHTFLEFTNPEGNPVLEIHGWGYQYRAQHTEDARFHPAGIKGEALFVQAEDAFDIKENHERGARPGYQVEGLLFSGSETTVKLRALIGFIFSQIINEACIPYKPINFKLGGINSNSVTYTMSNVMGLGGQFSQSIKGKFAPGYNTSLVSSEFLDRLKKVTKERAVDQNDIFSTQIVQWSDISLLINDLNPMRQNPEKASQCHEKLKTLDKNDARTFIVREPLPPNPSKTP